MTIFLIMLLAPMLLQLEALVLLQLVLLALVLLQLVLLNTGAVQSAKCAISDMSIGRNGNVVCMLCPKISASWEKLAPTGRHGRHVFATLI